MQKIKRQTMIDHAKKEVKNGSIYLWGGQGETLDELTDSYIRSRETSEANAKRVMKLRDARKSKYPNLRAFDCSGLIGACLNENGNPGFDTTADGYRRKCAAIDRSQLQAGDLVFEYSNGKSGHVGIYIGGGKVIEARGRDYGVVETDLDKRKWKRYGRPDFMYTDGETKPVEPESGWTVSRLLKKTSPLMKGDDVENLQKALIGKGYSCGGTGADGEYGGNTESAVEKFQKAKGLQVDGIAGEDTVTALGGKWGAAADEPAAGWTVSRLLKKVSPLMKGDDVKNLQKALIANGYSCGSQGADGEFGSGTESAVEKFQKAKGLSVDGIAGEKTVTALGGKWKESASWTVSRLLKRTSPLMKGDDVKNLQKALIAAGYSCGGKGADGQFGDNTESAVKKFQKAKGLTVDGKAGKNTITALGGKWNG